VCGCTSSIALFNSEANIARIAGEIIEDAFNEHIRVLELRYSPQYICIGHPNLDIHKVHRAIVDGITRAVKKYNIVVGLIGIIDRFMTVEQAEEVGIALQLFTVIPFPVCHSVMVLWRWCVICYI
jgi:adenosine deaminase